MADLPDNPNNRKEEYLADIAGLPNNIPDSPWNRKEMYLSEIAGAGGEAPDSPWNREEAYLAEIAGGVQSAKEKIVEKGGQASSDTGVAGLADEIDTIPAGGGVSIPTTWAELKSMTATDLKKIYPLGSFINLPCQYTQVGSDTYDFQWEVISYKPCKIENDNTDYPCVTLLLRTVVPDAYLFDSREQELANSSIEPTALSGTYYYGIATSSGNPSPSDVTALNLSTGDAIPYNNYPRIYKTSINTNDMSNIQHLWRYGYNNYPLSNIRQWLNAEVATGWFTPSHVGDGAPTYKNQPGFLYKLPSDFTSVLSATAVVSVLNSATDGGATVTTYDKMFIPSLLEMNFDTQAIEGAAFEGIKYGVQRGKPWPQETMPTALDATFINNGMRFRTAISSSCDNNYTAGSSGALNTSTTSASSSSPHPCPACRIILAGA